MAENQGMKARIESLINTLTKGLHERHEHVAVALLAAMAGLNTFLLGPPGTAKSMLARRLKSAFTPADGKEISYFEYLMNRFSTPEEIFGPVSIKKLKEDKYERKIEGFLPKADFAFLDEIWKSSAAILNTLLTIINEKTFRNGTEENVAVPLKSLIAASNETPPENQGLAALYDRFIVRLYVPPMAESKNFESLLRDAPVKADIKCGNKEAIRLDELDKWQDSIGNVKLSEETMQIIRIIRAQLDERAEELNVYVSDRRWQKSVLLLKAGAFFCGRMKTNLVDTLLLRHCLWTTDNNREKVIAVVEDEVRKSGFVVESTKIGELHEKINKLDEFINDNLQKKQKSGSLAINFAQQESGRIREGVKQVIDKISRCRQALEEQIDTPFVPKKIRNIALEGVDKQLEDANILLLECDRQVSRIIERLKSDTKPTGRKIVVG